MMNAVADRPSRKGIILAGAWRRVSIPPRLP